MQAYRVGELNGNVAVGRARSHPHSLLRILRAVASVIAERLAFCEVSAVLTAVGFVLCLGLVGGMECGVVPLYIGLPVCLLAAVGSLLAHFEE